MNTLEARVRRLELCNRALLTLLLLGALGIGAKAWIDAEFEDAHNLRTQWEKSGEVRFYQKEPKGPSF